MESNLTWRDVFNSDQRHYNSVFECVPVVTSAGYKYFSWNGRVYRIEFSSYKDTGILAKDIL